jgi:hypothetical protein
MTGPILGVALGVAIIWYAGSGAKAAATNAWKGAGKALHKIEAHFRKDANGK